MLDIYFAVSSVSKCTKLLPTSDALSCCFRLRFLPADGIPRQWFRLPDGDESISPSFYLRAKESTVRGAASKFVKCSVRRQEVSVTPFVYCTRWLELEMQPGPQLHWLASTARVRG